MPRDSNGVYTLPAGYLAVADELIQPEQHNQPLEDIEQALTDSMPRNGAAPMTADLDMGDHKIKNLSDATEDGDALSRGAADARYLQSSDFSTGRNLLINPDFSVRQRAAGLYSDDAYAYADRWYVLAQSGQVQSTLTGSEMVYYNQTGVANKRVGIAQIVESKNCDDCGSQSITLSGQAKAYATSGAAILWRYAILATTAAADSVTSDVVNDWTSTNYTPGNFFIAGVTVIATGSVTLPASGAVTDFPAITGTAPAGLKNLIFVVWSDQAIAADDGIRPIYFQLEKGTAATAFSRRLYPLELAFCQRYYCKRYAHTRFIAASAGDILASPVYWPVEMRIGPSVTVVPGARANVSTVLVSGDDTRGGARHTIQSTAAGECYAMDELLIASAEL